ncbi:MAG: hypothetical protein E6R03_16520 [Hyphomicrobiaceae bacterium]|nr:MAG: hypothetical protein E6R03_16520 [Hyphomicrobiaceae bacterium]
MKIILPVLLLSCVAAFAAEIPKPADVGGVPFHPYRKVGDNYYNLMPLYEWAKVFTTPPNRITAKQASAPRPMTDWVGVPQRYGLAIDVSYRVRQVLDDGLLVEAEARAYKIGTSSSRFILLKNYPWAGSVTDGQLIEFLALKVGVYDYVTVAGAKSVVDMYDYGTPYHPAILAAQKAATNSVEKTNAPATNSAAKSP